MFYSRAVRFPEPRQVFLHARAREGVKKPHRATRQKQPVRQVRAYEARTARDKDRFLATAFFSTTFFSTTTPAHTASPRDRSSARACGTLSMATWPSSHDANSTSPSSKETCGAYPSRARALLMSAKQWRMSPTR